MKVGTDGVLLGAWTAQNSIPTHVLDVGTGSGLIALMMAQRFPSAYIKGIDIHEASIDDAKFNVKNFPFNHQIEMEIADFVNFKSDIKFDMIVSNPPYFSTALLSKEEDKNRVRHQGHLNMQNFIQNAVHNLSPKGAIALILPTKEMLETIEIAQNYGLIPHRICDIKSYENQQVIRKMVEFSRNSFNPIIYETLVIYQSERVYTDEYKELTKEFYLNF